jgi:uncharacterized YigZ family protein
MILVEIKKSKFYGYAFNVESMEQVEQLLQQLKAEHKKATHICWATVIKSNGVELLKFSDDGEPSGTAGRPMASVLQKRGETNKVVFVVRYFGGIKLGGGGLVRAYTKATSEALDNANNTNQTNWQK